MDNRSAIPLRLRHQAWLAGGLLISPWLLSVCLYWPLSGLQPAAVLALLPGLAVAVLIQAQLAHRLGTNHRRGPDDPLFPMLGAANWITLARGAAVVGLAGFLPMSVQRGAAWPHGLLWAPGIFYLGISLADLLDGFVARKQGRETELGKRLDIETDAAGLLVASLAAVALGRLPSIYLLVGLAYYPFILGIWLRQRRALPVAALRPRPYARIIAGFQMGLVGAALLPIFNPVYTHAAALIFMTPLLIGFLRDWLVVSGRIKTDIHQQTALDRQARSWMTGALPMVLRLVLLLAGIAALAGYGDYQTHLPGRLAVGSCGLLAGFGFMGRSAALLLVLMLGGDPAPLGATPAAMVLFVPAAALMLTGTGGMSLWAPEEMILYRRPRITGPSTRFAKDLIRSPAVRGGLRQIRRWLPGVLGVALAWHALAGVTWAGVWRLLAGLGPASVLILVLVNLLMLPLMTARWWLLLRTLGPPVGLFTACAYRAAANAVSYLTPGPHFGGEPLAVYLLRHRRGIPLTTATASVVLDRLLELLASFAVLAFCLANLALAANSPFAGRRGVSVAMAVLAVLSGILAALFTGRRPFSRFVALFRRSGDWADFIARGEAMAETLFRGHRRPFMLANLLSLGHWFGVFAEFWLMGFLLGFPLSFWHLTAVVAVARLAFFTPLPAGLGVLESALPWVTAALGLGSALGISLCLIIRSRDLLFSLAGLGLAMQYLTWGRKAGIINEK